MKHTFVAGVLIFCGVLTMLGAGCAPQQKDTMLPQQTDDRTEKDAMQHDAMEHETMDKDGVEKSNMMTGDEKMMGEEKKMGSDSGMMDNKKMDTMDDKDKMMVKVASGSYSEYSAEALQKATANGGKAVLFFWAGWCPTCKQANADFTDHVSLIPDGVTVLKVNYDTEKELKTKYGITYQHTFVQVDGSGKQLAKWSGGGIADLKVNLK